MLFLLKHPELAKKVSLVFGAYKIVNGQKIDNETGARMGRFRDQEIEVKARRKLVDQAHSVVAEMSGREQKLINSLSEAYEYMDQIPEFKIDYDDWEKLGEVKVRVPHMYDWFSGGLGNFYDIRKTKEFESWGLGDTVLSVFDYWKMKGYDVAFFLNPESRRLMWRWNFESVLDSRLRDLDVRHVVAHVVRLLTHDNAPACSDFAVAVMKYLPELGADKFEKVYFNQITDGDEQAQFWTVAPYIYEALRAKRVMNGEIEDDREDFLKALLWLRSRKRVRGRTADSVFPGLAGLRHNIRDLYLPRSGFHPVHKYVEKVGEHIAEYLHGITVNEEVVFSREEVRKTDE